MYRYLHSSSTEPKDLSKFHYKTYQWFYLMHCKPEQILWFWSRSPLFSSEPAAHHLSYCRKEKIQGHKWSPEAPLSEGMRRNISEWREHLHVYPIFLNLSFCNVHVHLCNCLLSNMFSNWWLKTKILRELFYICILKFDLFNHWL